MNVESALNICTMFFFLPFACLPPISSHFSGLPIFRFLISASPRELCVSLITVPIADYAWHFVCHFVFNIDLSGLVPRALSLTTVFDLIASSPPLTWAIYLSERSL